ncbi:MAG: alpha/beta hydrolase, partial [Lachnospiraceae bacterium]|nr:alpha/beta hydrolase [Lachnospiraceae bacterium]
MNNKKNAILLAGLLVLSLVCMIIANVIQHGNGTITISDGVIEVDENSPIKTEGELYYKLYVPETATEANPAPAVLLLHGYQNDHETCAAYAIELAKRGVVVMALDEYG